MNHNQSGFGSVASGSIPEQLVTLPWNEMIIYRFPMAIESGSSRMTRIHPFFLA